MHIITVDLDENFRFHPAAVLGMQCAVMWHHLPAEQRAAGTPAHDAFDALIDHVAEVLADSANDPELHGTVSVLGLSALLSHLETGKVIPEDVLATIRRRGLTTLVSLLLGVQMIGDAAARGEERAFLGFLDALDSDEARTFVAEAQAKSMETKYMALGQAAAAIYREAVAARDHGADFTA